VVKQLGDRFKVQPGEIVARVGALQEELKATAKVLAAVRSELALAKAADLATQVEELGATASGVPSQLLVARLDGVEAGALQGAAQRLQEQLGGAAAVVLAGVADPAQPDKLSLVAAFGPEVIAAGLNAGAFIGVIARLVGGGGGGRPNLAQAGGRDVAALAGALEQARIQLRRELGG
jgi:alanyl-tRNA synthetase